LTIDQYVLITINFFTYASSAGH